MFPPNEKSKHPFSMFTFFIKRKDGRPKGGTDKKHSTEEKLVIPMRHLNNHESITEIEKKTGISNGQISNWVRIYISDKRLPELYASRISN